MSIHRFKNNSEKEIIDFIDRFSTEYYYGLPILKFGDGSRWVIYTGENFLLEDSLELWLEEHVHELSSEILAKGTGIPEIVFELLINNQKSDSTLTIIHTINASCGVSSFANFLVYDKNIHDINAHLLLSGGKEWIDIGEESSNCKAFRLS